MVMVIGARPDKQLPAVRSKSGRCGLGKGGHRFAVDTPDLVTERGKHCQVVEGNAA